MMRIQSTAVAISLVIKDLVFSWFFCKIVSRFLVQPVREGWAVFV